MNPVINLGTKVRVNLVKRKLGPMYNSRRKDWVTLRGHSNQQFSRGREFQKESSLPISSCSCLHQELSKSHSIVIDNFYANEILNWRQRTLLLLSYWRSPWLHAPSLAQSHFSAVMRSVRNFVVEIAVLTWPLSASFVALNWTRHCWPEWPWPLHYLNQQEWTAQPPQLCW